MIRRSFWDGGEDLINSGEKQKVAGVRGGRVEKRLEEIDTKESALGQSPG